MLNIGGAVDLVIYIERLLLFREDFLLREAQVRLWFVEPKVCPKLPLAIGEGKRGYEDLN
jgi:hypothetical protein